MSKKVLSYINNPKVKQHITPKQSAIKLNPFWKEVKPTEKFKEFYKKQTGLKAERLILAKKKYYDLLRKLLT